MSRWQLEALERNGPIIGSVKTTGARRFEFLLNRPCVIGAFDVPLLGGDVTRDLLAPGETELRVKREDVPIETVFSLAVGAVNARGDDPTVTCSGLGVLSYFQDALVYGQASRFTGTTLPWTWINTFQSRTGGDYGITQGPVSGTPATRYKTISQDTELLQQIVDLSESGAGFDFAIDPLRRYREWHTRRGVNNGLTLEWGVNCEFDYEENAGPGQLVSDVRVTGPDGTTPRTASDATARTRYGRREAALSYMSDFEEATVTNEQLQAYADAAAGDYSAPLIIPNVTIDTDATEWGEYDLGDTVRLKAEIGEYVYIDETYRIVGILVDVDEDDNEAIDLVLNLV